VLHALPKGGKVGLVVGIEDPSKYQKQLIDMEHVDSVVMGRPPFDQLGPDLGFLRLPKETIGWLKAQRSFYNLLRQRDDVLAWKEPSPAHCDVIIGMIHELTEDLTAEKPGVRRQQFTALFCNAKLIALRYPDHHYALFYFEPSGDDTFSLPKNFQGASGGAVWRFYVEQKEKDPPVLSRRIIGVLFFQRDIDDGRKEVTCHGPRGIYGTLVDKVVQRWPEETNDQEPVQLESG
jgi:hypothetical protein